jgi:hypothetical protein
MRIMLARHPRGKTVHALRWNEEPICGTGLLPQVGTLLRYPGTPEDITCPGCRQGYTSGCWPLYWDEAAT